MPEMTTHAPGTFCWIDLGTPDQDAAGRFYGALFGWEQQEDENAEQTGGYRVATLRGQAIGGVMKLMEEGQPPAWSSYVCVEDVDATVTRAKEAGGSAMFEPMDVLDYGRMAFIVDPTGAALGLWQPGRNKGAGLAGETGAMTWNELNTRDVPAAKEFYADVLGWSYEDSEFEGTGSYTAIKLGEQMIGGILDVTERVPAEVPAHWLVYFAVDEADATVATAKQRGAEIPAGPFDIPQVGRIAVVKDPWGAWFAVIQPDPAMQQGS
ncbi:MAG TPA: VOC family protein [Solirubrobacterales bacterium]|nr:VOC family protein [Solirubrobacterales bacterium]